MRQRLVGDAGSDLVEILHARCLGLGAADEGVILRCIPEAPVQPDRCPQRDKATLRGAVADGVFELLERVPRVLLQAADALRSGAMLDSEDRTEDRASEVSHSVKTLEQLTAAQPAGRVVDPDPEAVLDPLEIRLRPDGGGLIHRL